MNADCIAVTRQRRREDPSDDGFGKAVSEAKLNQFLPLKVCGHKMTRPTATATYRMAHCSPTHVA
jgi:hypothetical protein